MPFDPNALVDQVVSIIKSALAPIHADLAVVKTQVAAVESLRERVAVVETKADRPAPVPVIPEPPDLTPLHTELDAIKAKLEVVDGLRERVAVAETKADRPVPVLDLPEIPDLTPILERMAGAEARLSVIGDVRDRLVAVETKANQPQPEPMTFPDLPDLTPILERLSAAEARLSVIGDVRDRVVAVESKSMQPLLALPPEAGIDDLKDRIKTLEMRSEGPSPTDMAVVELRKTISDLTAELKLEVRENSALRERVAVLESRPATQGPPGEDGKDGLGFDDVVVEHDGERTFTFKYARGERVKTAGTFTLPVQIYRGQYSEGKTYEPGDTVTYGRALWHCTKATVLSPDSVGTRDPATGEPRGAQGKDFWKMAVRGGKDGKDGRDAVSVPVVHLAGSK